MTHDPDCIFCKIIAGQVPSKKVYEDEELFAFHDIRPHAPVHFMIVPKLHVASLAHTTEAHAALLGRILGGSWLQSVISGLVIGFGLFFIFDFIFDLPLPVGPIFG